MMLLSPGAAALVASPALRLSRCALSSLSASAAADPGYKAKQSDPGYKAKQSLGQNFLQDEAAAALAESDERAQRERRSAAAPGERNIITLERDSA